MKQMLSGLLIFLIIAPVVCADTCDFEIETGEDGTCGNYKIRHDSWDAGDQNPHQIAHYHLWRLSPYADLGSDSIDFWYESEGKYYDDNKLHVDHTGSSAGPPRVAKYTLTNHTPQLVVKGTLEYKDRNLNWVPARWTGVYIWELDPGIGDDDYLGSSNSRYGCKRIQARDCFFGVS